MKKTQKILLSCLCAAMLLAASVFGTLAYLTDSEEVTNTFTVGKVDIKLDEAKVNAEGVPEEGAERVQSNEYHLLPGTTYTKDPTVTVQPNSEKAYVRMILTVHNASAVQDIITNHKLEDFSGLIGGWDRTVWLYEGFTADEEENTISFEFRYKEIVSTQDTELELPALFKTLVLPGTVTGSELKALNDGNFKMVVTGHAIQAANFAEDTEKGLTAEDVAWLAFDAQLAQTP